MILTQPQFSSLQWPGRIGFVAIVRAHLAFALGNDIDLPREGICLVILKLPTVVRQEAQEPGITTRANIIEETTPSLSGLYG